MIIGVMRLFEEENNGMVTSEYQFKSLFKGDIVTRTQAKLSRETVFTELSFFKNECDANERDLVSPYSSFACLNIDKNFFLICIPSR
jgi:hypothetical protein